jgi:hypothetical protein
MNIERQTALEYFAFGYLKGLLYDTHTGESIKGVDEWVQMDDYDMNFIGQDHAEDVPAYALKVVVYPLGWAGDSTEVLHTFTTRG